MYSFGGRYYVQMAGGPTGYRSTMASSVLVMYDHGKQLVKILEQADIKVWMKSGYVVDIRYVISLFNNLK